MNTFDREAPQSQTETLVPRASHDTQAPPNLIEFMLKNWKAPSGKLPPPRKTLKYFQARRAALSALFPGEALVIPTGGLKVRSNDTNYPFRPATDFLYLTGHAEHDCVLVLAPEGKGHRTVLFVEPNPGKTDSTFYTDRLKGELWTGPRQGVKETSAELGIADCRALPELEAFLNGIEVRSAKGVRVRRGISETLEAMLRTDETRDGVFATALSELRLIKDEQELRELKAVVDSTKRGFDDVIARLKTAKSEREVEGVFFLRARMEGNDVGYGTIAAAGAHACVLHWNQNDGAIKKGDLLLLDAGIEGDAFYTADITRTLPVSGKFTREQRQVYEIVHAAQAAAFKKVKPGNDFMAPNRAAMEVLAHGLADLGILKCSAEEALRDENQFYKRYSLHNVSHMLGLDVHDCAQARLEAYKFGKLKPGMVLTVEPGLYFQPDDLTVPAKYRGIGVRIEDDVVVTERGMRNLSAHIPSTVEDVEKWMKGIWKKAKS